MATPLHPLQSLADALAATSVLKGFAKVALGNEALAYQGAPGRITLEPTDGDYDAPKYKTSLADVEQTIVAHCWGTDYGPAWDLQRRLLQGLEEQASNGGLWWQRGPGIAWSKTDTTSQGVGLAVTFTVRLGVERVQLGLGQVDAVSFTKGS
jgi:hypothetical protein